MPFRAHHQPHENNAITRKLSESPFIRLIRPAALAPLLCTTLLATGCATQSPHAPVADHGTATKTSPPSESSIACSDVWYEIFVRSWYDTNGDGIGDLNGVTAKLDYLKSLGISGIWLMPINPSPSYHGYDVTDYYGINPQYGTMKDFQRLLDEAHKRGIKVIIDLVINHTSDQHPWFLAASNPADPHHDWYSWAKPGTDLNATSATDTPAWHATPSGQHYIGVFTGTMPDLDYDTPAVREEMVRLGQFWLKKGVDGFRLDAAQHIYYDFKSQDGDPAVLKKNLTWGSEFRRGLDEVRPDAYVVGEVTQDDAEKLAPWFKPLSAVFDFPLATHLIDSAKSERAGDLGGVLARTDAAYRKATGKSGVDAPFLSNHDQERVMSQLDGNAQHMRMAAALLLTLPGQPFVYYGEELGMRGKKPDPDLREPMRWNRDPHARGTTAWEASTSGNGSAVSVAAEQADPDSLLNYYTKLIHWRSTIPALRDGDYRIYPEANDHLLAWQRADAHGAVLVIHNLSGQPQSMPLDVPGQPRYTRVLRQSTHGASLHDGRVQLPPYSSVVLQ
ncbi:alpha-amylase [Rhodanobacter panaciterrae]|uniref:Alpha-amylase n=1 Tax=Rhodanobacter panaciterrae TaxID=490572 RepID=A0ABQ3A3U8_9GAMM|nr:alpha-amylase family glycosyl hydrolase [Rhodanobacter panaciterrae]GGY33497.1 alpha-amylase [Rhodanobacter panaciterrae]